MTGISSDIGGIIARNFAADSGMQVVGTMRRSRSPEIVFPPNVRIIDNCDLAVTADCAKLAALVDEQFDGPFGYVHSVGDFWEHVPFLDVGPDQARHMFDSHVTTLYNVFHSLVPVMRAKGGASCVAFSCNSVRYNYPWMASFTAAKAATESLIRSLANEFSGDGLRFNSLVLASVKTPKVLNSKPHGDFEHYISPEDLVPIIRFLMSREARLINASSINLFEHSPLYYRQGYFERIGK